MSANRLRRDGAGRSGPVDLIERLGSQSGLKRRRFLQSVGASAGLFVAPAILKGIRADAGDTNSELFSLGVASGDPTFNSIVLWTRLAPDPLMGGGMPRRPVRVEWEVATDPGMANVIRTGLAVSHSRNGHAVHVLAAGLPSNSWFYYRFYAMSEASRVGRTRTFPSRRDGVDHMRFAVANCQDFRDGFYPAYRDMVEQEDVDFVVHVGDYIYENGPRDVPIAEGRNHNSEEVITVEDYRNRYSLYRMDQNLQNAHARFPFIVTPDDHDVDNNYAGLIPVEDSPTQGEEFVARRRNAYQVYSEMMPLRRRNQQRGRSSRLPLFRRLQFGDLADIHVLDTRQFRSDQPAEDGLGSTDPDSLFVEDVLGEQLFDADGILDPNATMLGAQQEAWLTRNLSRSRSTWNILAQQVMVTRWNLVETSRATIKLDPSIPAPLKELILQGLANVDDILSVDAWDGYQAARQRLFDVLSSLRPNNPIVLSGDVHSAWSANLLEDFSDQNSDILAAEFVSTSISSTFEALDPRPADAVVRAGIALDNPHVEYFNGLFRGYSLCDVSRDRWETTYRAVGSLGAIGSPDPNALIPFEDTPVETDAIVGIDAGFNEPGSNARLETMFARVPLLP